MQLCMKMCDLNSKMFGYFIVYSFFSISLHRFILIFSFALYFVLSLSDYGFLFRLQSIIKSEIKCSLSVSTELFSYLMDYLMFLLSCCAYLHGMQSSPKAICSIFSAYFPFWDVVVENRKTNWTKERKKQLKRIRLKCQIVTFVFSSFENFHDNLCISLAHVFHSNLMLNSMKFNHLTCMCENVFNTFIDRNVILIRNKFGWLKEMTFLLCIFILYAL